jgi:P27 family predicted phage terminase small subunit
MGGKGSGGRNRKPTAVKKVQGNPGKRRLNKREPKPKPGMPAMPVGMPVEACAEWQRMAPILEKMGVLTVADGPALAAYCKLHAQVLQAEAAIKKYGIVLATLDGETGVAVLRKNPAVTVKSESLRLVKAFLLEFGLTPASRSKLTVTEGRDLEPDVKAQNALEDFLSRKPAGRVPQ